VSRTRNPGQRRAKLSDPGRTVLAMQRLSVPGMSHPALRRVSAAIDELIAIDTSQLTVIEHAELIVRTAALQASLRRAELRVIADIDSRGIAAEYGMTTAEFVAARSHMSSAAAEAMVEEARAIRWHAPRSRSAGEC
jgi:hypothetical protein